MSDTVAAQLRRALIEIDREILGILTTHSTLGHPQLERVATLEQARVAAHRLLLAAEAGELKNNA